MGGYKKEAFIFGGYKKVGGKKWGRFKALIKMPKALITLPNAWFSAY